MFTCFLSVGHEAKELFADEEFLLKTVCFDVPLFIKQ